MVQTKRRWRGGLRTAAVGAAALGVGEVIAAMRGDSLIDTIGRVVIDTAPVPVVEATVSLSGRHDKAATRLGVGAGMVAATVGLAGLPDRTRALAVAAVGSAAVLVALRKPSRSPATVTGIAAATGVLAAGLRRPSGTLGRG